MRGVEDDGVKRAPLENQSLNYDIKIYDEEGYELEAHHEHGFRATASTMLNEMGYRTDVIERQLAHAERNKVRASYNQAEYMDLVIFLIIKSFYDNYT